MALRNRYFNNVNGAKEFQPWFPPEVPCGTDLPDSAFFGEIMVEMERRLDASGLTVYLTQNVDELPSYGDDVVVILMSDELTRVPAYFKRVRAIVKNQAVRPYLTSNVFLEPSWVNVWWLVAYGRMLVNHVPGATAYAVARRRPGVRPAPIFMVPIGVLSQVELPIVPLRDRSRDVFFAGSVVHRPGAVSKLRERAAPKTLARESMLREARRVADRHPELTIDLVERSGGFVDSIHQDPLDYSRRMMDSCVALVPRGATADTSRFWQALRYGCIPIVDTVPRHSWFYDDAPVVKVSRWSQLEDVLLPLLRDAERMQDLHERGLEYWRTRGSAEAVGAYIAERLNRLPA